MATFRELRRTADKDASLATGTDSTTPSGTFYAVTRVLGLTTTYLLAGEPDDDEAPILGRIEHWPGGATYAYAGGGIKGGALLSRRNSESSEDAFREMLATCARRMLQDPSGAGVTLDESHTVGGRSEILDNRLAAVRNERSAARRDARDWE